MALRGVNDMEFDELIRWSHGRGMDLVLIEVMPMGEIGEEARLDQYLPLSLARAGIAKSFTLTETDYRTGGPSAVENLYTPELLRGSFADCDIELLTEYEDVLDEGLAHRGRSALIGMVARRI